MKKVWLRVSECVTIDVAAKHLESLGYKNVWGDWRPESPNAIAGERNGEISWDTDLDFLTNDNYQEIFIPTTKHKHYDLIVAWAANPSQKVWYKGSGDDWRPVEISPSWRYEYDWYIGDRPPKRKIMIGDAEIDAPEVENPSYNRNYFVPSPTKLEFYTEQCWGENASHTDMQRGLVHLNKEAAIAHAKALIKVSGGCVDE